MKLSQLPTVDAILEEELRDPAFREEWGRTALARAVALGVVRYRAQGGLSQRKLAEVLGWKPPQVARPRARRPYAIDRHVAAPVAVSRPALRA